MATKLNFTKDGSQYVCELNPAVPITVHVQTVEKKDFTVYGFISPMKPVALFASSIYDNIIFQVDVPDGVTVRMVSQSAVIDAQMV